MGDYVDLAHRQTVFEGLGGYSDAQGTISGVGESFHVLGLKATPDLLATLRVRPILGRTLQPEDSRPGAAPVILLGHDLWQSHFGSDPHIAGRGVTLDGLKVQVVGVTPPGFRFPPNARTEMIVPLAVPFEAPAERKSAWTFAVARLKAKASFQQANSELAAISRRLAQEYPRSNEALSVTPTAASFSMARCNKGIPSDDVIMHFGVLSVYGLSRVPLPAARIIAALFIALSSIRFFSNH